LRRQVKVRAYDIVRDEEWIYRGGRGLHKGFWWVSQKEKDY
jgi:hypothetical protein